MGRRPSPADPRQWLSRTLGAGKLARRVEHLRDTMSKSELSRRDILERHHIELMLVEDLARAQAEGADSLFSTLMGDTLFFSARAEDLHLHLSREAQVKHAGMLRAALDAEHGFAAVRTEYTAIGIGLELGCDVELVDLEGLGNFDLLLCRDGEEVEMECKLLSQDFAASVSVSRFDRLCRILEFEHRSALLKPGSSRVVWLALDGDLPKGNEELAQFAGSLVALVESSAPNFKPPLRDARTENWPPGLENPNRAYAEARFITSLYGHYTIEFHNSEAAIIFVLAEGADGGKLLTKRLGRKLKDAADQCSGKRPAALFVEFEGPSPFKPNREAAKRLVASQLEDVFRTRPHLELVILGFAGPPFTGGYTYPIPNPGRKRRNQAALIRSLEKHARTTFTLPRGHPRQKFVSRWWNEKYNWSYKSPMEFLREVAAGLRRRKKKGSNLPWGR